MATALSWIRSEKGRSAWAAAMALGGLLLAVAYIYVSNHGSISGQVSMIVGGGIGALLLVGAGGAGLILVDLTDECHKLNRIERCLEGGDPADVERPRPLDVPVIRTAAIIGGVGLVGGSVLVVIGWARAGGADDANDMFGALSIGAIGIVAAGVAAASATLSAMRRVRLRGAEIFAPWILAGVRSVAPTTTSRRIVTPAQVRARPRDVVVGADLARFHAPGCPVVGDRDDYRTIDVSAVDAGVAPCGICLEDMAFGVNPDGTIDDTAEMVATS